MKYSSVTAIRYPRENRIYDFLYFQVCDRIKYPTIMAVLGDLIDSFCLVFMGTLPFIPIEAHLAQPQFAILLFICWKCIFYHIFASASTKNGQKTQFSARNRHFFTIVKLMVKFLLLWKLFRMHRRRIFGRKIGISTNHNGVFNCKNYCFNFGFDGFGL